MTKSQKIEQLKQLRGQMSQLRIDARKFEKDIRESKHALEVAEGFLSRKLIQSRNKLAEIAALENAEEKNGPDVL